MKLGLKIRVLKKNMQTCTQFRFFFANISSSLISCHDFLKEKLNSP